MNQILPDEEVFCDCDEFVPTHRTVDHSDYNRDINYRPAPTWANNVAYFVAGLAWGWLIGIAIELMRG